MKIVDDTGIHVCGRANAGELPRVISGPRICAIHERIRLGKFNSGAVIPTTLMSPTSSCLSFPWIIVRDLERVRQRVKWHDLVCYCF